MSIMENKNLKKKIVVWIIEDNTLYRKNLVAVINDQSEMICEKEFSSCEEAIAKIHYSKQPDVVLQDIGFPGMNGIRCVETIKNQYPATQIIMITVFDDTENIFSAICAGATGYLLKTSSSEIITKSIYDVLSGGSPMNSSVARKAIDVFSKLHNVAREYGLSNREKEILEQIAQGFGNKHIAEHFNISTHTIDAHLRKIYDKLHVHSRTGAAAKAIKERLI